MPQTHTVMVLDLIRVPPTVDPYGHLKEGLLQMYALTDYARYMVFFSLPLTGDMLPFNLMLKMLSLLPFGHEAWFFSAELFSNATLYLWPSALMRFIRAKIPPPPLSAMLLPPQMSAQFLPSMPLLPPVLVTSAFQPLVLTIAVL